MKYFCCANVTQGEFQATTADDEGLISCYSEEIDKKDVLVNTIRLVVHKDWEEVYETDSNVSFCNRKRFLYMIDFICRQTSQGHVWPWR